MGICVRFREIERNNLDRHSYEIQIKELTERATGEDSLRNENSKLKEFSKRLQVEMGGCRVRSSFCKAVQGRAVIRMRLTRPITKRLWKD